MYERNERDITAGRRHVTAMAAASSKTIWQFRIMGCAYYRTSDITLGAQGVDIAQPVGTSACWMDDSTAQLCRVMAADGAGPLGTLPSYGDAAPTASPTVPPERSDSSGKWIESQNV
ncbi:hypothetical protein B0H11DRAFT_1905404 [Mycena galericulata]|nr:hypothetical protein B0H11DRAFT_1905404 [Mycena galericulata]